MKKPGKKDYAPFYDGYIQNITEDVFKVLGEQLHSTNNFLKSISEEKSSYAYAEGKWTIKEVIGHLIDAERIFSYRALAISRGEEQPLPGWDEKEYTPNGNFNERTLDDLANELKLMREANLLLFNSFNDEMLDKRGIASGKEVTVLAILFIITGHQAHHIKVLKERYLK